MHCCHVCGGQVKPADVTIRVMDFTLRDGNGNEIKVVRTLHKDCVQYVPRRE